MSLEEFSDTELWESILRGNQAAFAYFFKKHWSAVYAAVYFHLKDREVSKEITHDIFLNIWLKRDHLEILSFSAYLKAAGRYHVIRYLKQQKVKAVEFSEEFGEVVRNRGEEVMVCRELEERVEGYVEELPKRCKEVFLMSRREMMSNGEIAGRLGISKRTVENQITYALQYLRSMLKAMTIFMF